MEAAIVWFRKIQIQVFLSLHEVCNTFRTLRGYVLLTMTTPCQTLKEDKFDLLIPTKVRITRPHTSACTQGY